MTLKKVEKVTFASSFDMGGFPVKQPLPGGGLEQVDPFLLLHHATVTVKPGTDHRHAGVGPHPHRGFSPVTFIYQGAVHHRDSRGNDSVVHAGGVQWMHAGAGIIHSERPSRELAGSGGVQEIIQLWINTPASRKMEQPSYQAITSADIRRINLAGGKGTAAVAAGTFMGTDGPMKPLTELTAVNLTLQNRFAGSIPVKPGHNSLLYLLDGAVRIEGHGKLDGLHMAVFGSEGDEIIVEATEDTRALFLSGVPLGEPLETYGPFVMNNTTQIMEAVRDFQMGKMGVLVEEF